MVHYRRATNLSTQPEGADDSPPSGDRLIPALLLLLGGVRVLLGLEHGEVFGAEATIALFVAAFAALSLMRSAVPSQRSHSERRH